MMKTATTRQTDTDGPRLVVNEIDLRAYEPEWVYDPRGEHRLLVQQCEQLVGRSWQPFQSVLAVRVA